jgi:Protein of unknown function (DUF998)
MRLVINRAFGLIVIGCVLYWVALVLTMHVMEPEFDPIRAPISAYVVEAYGAWMSTTYPVWSLALLGAGLALVRMLPRTRLSNTAFFFFIIAAAGCIVAGLFPMDFPPPLRTLSGHVHAIGGGLAIPSTALGAFLFSLSFRRETYWRKVFAPAIALSSGIIAILVLGISSLFILGFAGYAQRLLFVLLIGWMILVSAHLIRFPVKKSPAVSLPNQPRQTTRSSRRMHLH